MLMKFEGYLAMINDSSPTNNFQLSREFAKMNNNHKFCTPSINSKEGDELLLKWNCQFVYFYESSVKDRKTSCSVDITTENEREVSSTCLLLNAVIADSSFRYIFRI